MTEVNKILGQVMVIGGDVGILYTVPSGKQAVISSYTACNLNVTGTTFRLSVAVAGAVDDPKQYLHFGTPLEGLETFEGTLGITLNSGDVVRTYSPDDNVSFNLFGVEITP